MSKKIDTPWGSWEVIREADSYKIKEIIVKPGQRLSYQKHSKREEFWTIVQGRATVTLDGDVVYLEKGNHIHIPIGACHRISNTSSFELKFIEVQLGTYFGEDDIVRIEDDYGRS